ncbi:hypothetical protein GQ457_09G021020 [Hibiscus cannabinus]
MQRLAKEELHVDVPINLCSKQGCGAKMGLMGEKELYLGNHCLGQNHGKIALNKELSSYCYCVNWNGAEGYEVAWGDDIYVVDIAGKIKKLMNNFIVVYSLHCLVISFGPRTNLGPLCPPIEKKMPGRSKKNEGKNKGKLVVGLDCPKEEPNKGVNYVSNKDITQGNFLLNRNLSMQHQMLTCDLSINSFNY